LQVARLPSKLRDLSVERDASDKRTADTWLGAKSGARRWLGFRRENILGLSREENDFRRPKWLLELRNLWLYYWSKNKWLLIDALQFFLQTPL
jgi:hypothetical protein